jgi:4,5-DOPA dioxygenase extradiol
VADIDNTNAKPYDWAIEFDERVKRNLTEGNTDDLLNCHNASKETSLSVPTLDHYLPMIFAIAMKIKEDKLEFIYEGFQNRSISMRCFKIG